jgi:phage tail sheath gpL-like
MSRDLKNNLSYAPTLEPQTISATATGRIVDLWNYIARMFLTAFGSGATITATNKWTLTFEAGDDSALGDAAAIDDSELDGVIITNSGTGRAQVETATAAGTITGSGNAAVVITAAGMTGSPKTLAVAVLENDTAADWAAKVRTALDNDAAVTALFTVGGSTTAITLTQKANTGNDATLNIALTNGTCTGITPAASSANTTAGIAANVETTITASSAGAFVLNDYFQYATGEINYTGSKRYVRAVVTKAASAPNLPLDIQVVRGGAKTLPV